MLTTSVPPITSLLNPSFKTPRVLYSTRKSNFVTILIKQFNGSHCWGEKLLLLLLLLFVNKMREVVCALTVSLRKSLHQISAPGTQGKVYLVIY